MFQAQLSLVPYSPFPLPVFHRVEAPLNRVFKGFEKCFEDRLFTSDYPGTGFGKTESIRRSRRVHLDPCVGSARKLIGMQPNLFQVQDWKRRGTKRRGPKNEPDLPGEKSCGCSAGLPRPDEFYDTFLATSVKESGQYKQLLKKREEKKKTLQVYSLLYLVLFFKHEHCHKYEVDKCLEFLKQKRLRFTTSLD